MRTIFRKEAFARKLNRNFTAIDGELPVVHVTINNRQVQKIIERKQQYLNVYEQQLQKESSRFQSQSDVRNRFLALEKTMQQLEDSFVRFKQEPQFDNGRIFYDQFCRYIDFIAKEIAFAVDGNVTKLARHGVTEKTVVVFFEALFDEVVIAKNAEMTSQIGCTENDIQFFMMDTNVLYNFPAMLKTTELPNFVLNIASYFLKDTTRGKIRAAVSTYAIQRIVEGLGLAPVGSQFLFQVNPFAQLSLSTEKVTVILPRKRIVLKRIEQWSFCQTVPVHIEEGRYERQLLCVEENEQCREMLMQFHYVAELYNDTETARHDAQYVPIELELIDDIETYVAQLIAQMDESYVPLYTVIFKRFLRKEV